MVALPYPVTVFIAAVIVGVVVCLFTYPILKHLKHKPTRRSTITLFAMGVAGGIVYELLYWPLMAFFGWMGYYHYNPLTLPVTFGIIILAVFLLYFPVALFMAGLKPRKALIVAGFATAITVPAYWLGMFVAYSIAHAIP